MFAFNHYTNHRTALITKLADYLKTPEAYKTAIQNIIGNTQLNIKVLNELITNYLPDGEIQAQVDLQRVQFIRYTTIICDIVAAGALTFGSIHTYYTALPYIQHTTNFASLVMLSTTTEAKDVYKRIGTAIVPIVVIRVIAITTPTLILTAHALLGAMNAVIAGNYVRAVVIALPVAIVVGTLLIPPLAKAIMGISVAVLGADAVGTNIKNDTAAWISSGVILLAAMAVGVKAIYSAAGIVGTKAIACTATILSTAAILGAVTMVAASDYKKAAVAIGIPLTVAIVAREGVPITADSHAPSAAEALAHTNVAVVATAVLGTALIVDIGTPADAYERIGTIQVALSKTSSELIVTLHELFKDSYNAIKTSYTIMLSYIDEDSALRRAENGIKLTAQTQALANEEALKEGQGQCETFESYVQLDNPAVEAVGAIANQICLEP